MSRRKVTSISSCVQRQDIRVSFRASLFDQRILDKALSFERMSSSDKYTPPYPEQKQPGTSPGSEKEMNPRPDFGENSYKGHNKLKGKVALVTGADSGIGRAIALAFAREGADIAVAYWKEHEDAKETEEWIKKTGRKVVLLPGDLADEATCQKLIDDTLKAFGKLDILVNNASQQEDLQESFTDISRERLEHTYKVNILAMFSLAQKATRVFLKQGHGGNIINVGSIQAYMPTPGILDYSTTKGAITTMTKGIAMELATKKIRCNVIAPGPVWTPLVISSFPTDATKEFGASSIGVPMKRPAHPKEYQATAVYLACDEDSSYVTGAVMNVTGGSIIG